MVQIEILGVKQTQKFLNKKSKNITKGTEIGLINAALHVQNEVKLSIAGRKAEHRSVDTGRFINSVDKVVSKFGAMVFSDLEYAKFLEFGTRKFNARRHFMNTKSREKINVLKILNKEVKKAVNKKI